MDAKKSEAVIDAIIDVVKSRLNKLSDGKYAVSKATVRMIKDKISGNIGLFF
ncbi:hypothetical protein [Wohlfahrtiimonas chitiniclastica]|uniref:hypothetical protein n=1 Tax=Wohlfahrtiimonas chitiniclastica TaxID=400946 RepID=UPI00164B79DD|nr:hypothetical protein [Wohlfahrtiimonas chitiniclastica]